MQVTVQEPLILNKGGVEIAKTAVRNVVASTGSNWRDWRRIIRREPPENLPRITPETAEEVVRYSTDTLVDYAELMRPKSAEALKNTCEYQTVPLVRHVLENEQDISRIVDIGCAYVRAHAEVAEDHPATRWEMLDFALNLQDVNSDIATDNMTFHSCYPLEWLEQAAAAGEKIDVAVVNRVFAILPNAELRSYFDVMAKVARFVVFSEVGCTLRYLSSVNLDEIDPKESVCPRWRLQMHNYRRILDEYGFSMDHYDAFRTPIEWHGEQHFMIRGIARNRGAVATP